jgi:hypothetical protein
MSKSIEIFDARQDWFISRAGIRAIFNLESPDEHIHCGHGNHPSGFSYDPAEFMDVGSKINSLSLRIPIFDFSHLHSICLQLRNGRFRNSQSRNSSRYHESDEFRDETRKSMHMIISIFQ